MNATRRFCSRLLPLVMGVMACVVVPACHSAPYLRQRAVEAFESNRLERAERLFNEAARKDPSTWFTHYHLGLIHLRNQRPLDAQLALELALSIRPSDAQTPQTLDALAEAMYQQGDRATLHGVLSKACADFGTSHDFLRQGKYLAMLGDADNAHVAFRKAAKFAPRDTRPYVAMADFYESISDRHNAVNALRRALHIEPANPRIQRRLREMGVVPGPTVELPVDDE